MADHQNEAELDSLTNESPDDTNVMGPRSHMEEEYKETQARKESVQDGLNQNTLAAFKEKIKNHLNFILLGVVIFGVILSIVGGILPKQKYNTFDNYEIVKDYSNCTMYIPEYYKGNVGVSALIENHSKCTDYLKEKFFLVGKECICFIQLEIKQAMIAPVTAYYELDGYEQISNLYSQSRDDNQLAGHLSLEPSESCGSQTYACMGARKPIAPCGRLADAMFNDTFSLQFNFGFVPTIRYGLISEDEKNKFHNPESTGDLSEAFSNFSKPMSWTLNVWELDIKNPNNNNGFRNEQFIVWMKTDMKRKPVWRVNHTGMYEKGLPAANYTLRVGYVYPTPRFGGQRKFIISSPDGNEVVLDYTDCTKLEKLEKCRDHIYDNGIHSYCTCYIGLEIKQNMTAPVTAYYELDAYEQISGLYSKSRDDDQLAGHLSLEPSESCGSHTYACTDTTTSRKPIAPCGRLADAMFNDTFDLESINDSISYFRYGLISEDDKKPYHNPEPVGNLTEAFINFSKPMSWRKNVWELDTSNPDNNGFRNEQFIIWMKTDLKRKPVWRVNHTGMYEKGLPAGNYTLKVIQSYPTPRFGGRRKFILSSREKIVTLGANGAGVTLLVIGVLCIIAASSLLLFRCRGYIASWFHHTFPLQR